MSYLLFWLLGGREGGRGRREGGREMEGGRGREVSDVSQNNDEITKWDIGMV